MRIKMPSFLKYHLIFLLSAAALLYSKANPHNAELQWSQKPHAYCSSAVNMAVIPFADLIDLEYQFECVEGGGHSSGWQRELSYRDSGLEPQTEYSYRVHVRRVGSNEELTVPTAKIAVRTQPNGLDSESRHNAKIDSAFAGGKIEIIPLLVNGDKDNRLNILIINRWRRGQENAYNNTARRDEFIADARHVLNVFKPGDSESIEPYVSYVNFFNVFAVWWPDVPPYDADDRVTSFRWEEYDEIRNRIILPWQSKSTGYATAMNMFNGDGGGGGAANFRDIRSSHAMIVGNKISSFIHEFSHTAPRIPDEYCSGGIWGFGGEGTVITNEYRRDEIKWRAWIDPTTPVPTPYSKEYLGKVGLFEGGQHRLSGNYRATARGCLMGAGTFAHTEEQLCPPCRQQSVLGFYEWVNVFDRIFPENKDLVSQAGQTLHFAIQRIRPEPDTQTTEWRLNGQIIAVNTDAIEFTAGSIDHYELKCSVSDETRFIRDDPPYTKKPEQSVTWSIENEGNGDPEDQIRITLTGENPVFLGEASGSIFAEISGGRPPYTYQWQDGSAVKDRSYVGPGNYSLTVTDADFRRGTAAISLIQEQNNDPQLQSAFNGSTWQIRVDGIEYPGDITCRWSIGRIGTVVSSLSDGRYQCTVTHANGARLTKKISLETPEHELKFEGQNVIPSCGGNHNGTVSLTVSGGLPPYKFIWSDGVVLNKPERREMTPGSYMVRVQDQNLTSIRKNINLNEEPGFEIKNVKFENINDSTIGISNPSPDVNYLWYDKDIPPYLARFPQGIYTGKFSDDEKSEIAARAYVIPNKYGLFVVDKEHKNDDGYWISLMLYVRGRDQEPESFRIPTASEEMSPVELTAVNRIWNEETDTWIEAAEGLEGNYWSGHVEGGSLNLKVKGKINGNASLQYNGVSPSEDRPLHTGNRFIPDRPGNYFVSAQKKQSKALSLNRIGVAVSIRDPLDYIQPIDPGNINNARILMWLDASDMDADGVKDAKLPRKAMFGWRSKDGGTGFGENNFVNFQPNSQNGLGTASWQYIWIQSLQEEVNHYQTIFMVRKEHDLSDLGSAPWQGLNKLIGTGEYGGFLMTPEVEEPIRQGAVYLNGTKVDPFTTAMPESFYLSTYEFPQPVDQALKRTDGYWEGSLAECIIFDKKLREEERRGVESYLYRKWISAVKINR